MYQVRKRWQNTRGRSGYQTRNSKEAQSSKFILITLSYMLGIQKDAVERVAYLIRPQAIVLNNLRSNQTRPLSSSPKIQIALEQSTDKSHWGIPPRLCWRYVVCIEIQRASSRCDVHVTCMDEHLPVSRIELPEEVEGDDERSGKIVLEKVTCVQGLYAQESVTRSV